MTYETIYEIASSPPQAIKQILLDVITQKHFGILLFGFPIAAALLSWLKRMTMRDSVIVVVGGEVFFILFIVAWALGFGY